MASETDPALVWGKRLAESGVPQLIEQLHQLAGAELDRHDGTTTSMEMLFRIRRISTAAVQALDRSDPALISDHVLNVLSQNLSPALDWLTQWSNVKDENQLSAVLSHLDATLSAIADIPTVDLSIAESEIADLRQSARRARQSAEAQIARLSEQSDQASAATEGRVQDSAAKVAEIQAEIDGVRNEHRSLLDQARQMDTARQDEFSAAEQGRADAFSALVDEQRKGNQQLNESLQAATAKQIDTAKRSAEEAIAHLETRKAEADALVGLIGEEALVGSYETEARQEQRKADVWRWVSVAAVVASIAFASVLFLGAPDPEWASIVTRIVLLAPLGAIAAYAARQSSEHRSAERDLRHLGLQLKAFGPYLDRFPDLSGRDQLVKDVAMRIFGQPRSGRLADEESADSPVLMEQLLSLVRELGKISR